MNCLDRQGIWPATIPLSRQEAARRAFPANLLGYMFGSLMGKTADSWVEWTHREPYRLLENALFYERKGCRSLATQFYAKAQRALREVGLEELALETERKISRVDPRGVWSQRADQESISCPIHKLP